MPKYSRISDNHFRDFLVTGRLFTPLIASREEIFSQLEESDEYFLPACGEQGNFLPAHGERQKHFLRACRGLRD